MMEMAINFDKSIEYVKKVLKAKEFFTPKELVKFGIYGSKSSVHRAIRNGELGYIYASQRRIAISKDSIIENIQRRCKEALH